MRKIENLRRIMDDLSMKEQNSNIHKKYMKTIFLDIQNCHNKSDFINEEFEDMYEEITREHFQKLNNCEKEITKRARNY